MVDTVAQALSYINNISKKGDAQCVVKPVSNLLRNILSLMHTEGYIGEFEIIDNGKGGLVKINLIGAINGCGVISPRFSTSVLNFERFEKRYLPAKGYGLLIVSTTKGIMTQEKARKEGIGGRLLAYVY